MSIRSIIVLAGALCVAPLTVLTAQQSIDTTGAAAPAARPAATPPQSGPRLSPQFERAEPTLAPSNSAAPVAYTRKGQHTIVMSTVVLVLAVVILVLLIAR